MAIKDKRVEEISTDDTGDEPQDTRSEEERAMDTLGAESETDKVLEVEEEQAPVKGEAAAEPVVEDEEDHSEDIIPIDGKDVTLGDLVDHFRDANSIEADVTRRAASMQADATNKWTNAKQLNEDTRRRQQDITRQTARQPITTQPPTSLAAFPPFPSADLQMEDGAKYDRQLQVYFDAQARARDAGNLTSQQVEDIIAKRMRPMQARTEFDAVEAKFRTDHKDLSAEDVEAVITQAADSVEQGIIRKEAMHGLDGKLSTRFLEQSLAIYQSELGVNNHEQEIAAAERRGAKKVLRVTRKSGPKPIKSGGGSPPKTGYTQTEFANLSQAELGKMPQEEKDAYEAALF